MPNYSISKQTKVQGQGSWVENVSGAPSDTFAWMITFNNTGNTELKNVKIVDNIPANMTVVTGSVKLTNGNYPNGFVYDASAIQANGRQVNIDIGNYAPGILAYITYRTTVSDPTSLTCGDTNFVNEAFATPTGYGAIRDIATAKVTKTGCVVDTPVYSCDAVTVEKIGGRKVRVAVNATNTPKDRVQIKNYEYNFGDGSAAQVTDKNPNEYEYAKDGTYSIKVKVNFTVDGVMQTASGDKCAAVVTFAPTPTTLPRTGSSSTLGVFIVTTMLSMIAFRAYAVRKN
jgi:uncharacterized repeat protein (TIGR01451 family)